MAWARTNTAAVWLAGMAVVASGCSSSGLLTRLSVTASPHERYVESLRAANLHGTAMARDWLRAGDAALANALAVPLPFREAGYLALEAPAVAYQLDLQRGRTLTVEVTFESSEPGQLFVDLFQRRDDEAPQRVASLGEGLSLSYEVARDGAYILRVQPELMRSGRFTIAQRTVASLGFPVSGLTAAAVQSEFGAARDAGRREHQGIDIFAKRGSPVVAVKDGRAQTGTNPLGGNVVWLREERSGRRFYYAHLDRWAFDGSAPVRAGDVLGYVGNTGNARTTAPHLHFGIYEQGAVDPLPFLQKDDAVPPPVTGSLDQLGEWVRVSAARTPLRDGVARTAAVRAQLERTAVVRLIGVANGGLRVAVPDGTTGYVATGAAVPARTALRQHRLAAGAMLRERPFAHAPAVDVVDAPVDVGVVGTFGGFMLVRRSTSPAEAWVETANPARTSSAERVDRGQ